MVLLCFLFNGAQFLTGGLWLVERRLFGPHPLTPFWTSVDEPLALLNSLANYSNISPEEKQKILEANSLEDKFMLLNSNLEKENQVLDLEDQIVSQVKTQMNRSQREYFLTEQLKAIERELGVHEEENVELEELHREIQRAGLAEALTAGVDP